MSKEKYTGLVAATVIEHEGKFLMAKRKDDKTWEFVGGKQEKGETIEETAERELKEETNLNAKAQEAGQAYLSANGEWEIVPVLMDLRSDPSDIKLTDHLEYRWIEPEEIDDINAEKEKPCLEEFGII